MKTSKSTSSPNVIKHAASAALIAAMIAPAGAQVAYAQDVPKPKTDSDSSHENIQSDSLKTKNRDEAQANYDRDLIASQQAQEKLASAKDELAQTKAARDEAVKKYNEDYAVARDAFASAKATADKDLQDATRSLSNAEADLAAKKTALDSADKQLKEAEQKVSEAQASFDKLSNQLKDQGKSPQMLAQSQTKLNDAQSALDAAKKSIASAQDAQTKAQTELESSESAKAEANREAKLADEKLAEATTAKTKADADLKAAESAYAESLKDADAQKLSDAQNAKADAQAKLTEAQKALTTNTEAYNAADAKLKQAQAEQKKAQASKEEASNREQQAKSELDSANKAIKEKRAALDALNPQIVQAQTNHNALTNDLKAAQKELDAKKAEVTRLQAEKDAAQKAFDKAKEQVQNNLDAHKLSEGAFNFFKSLADDGSADAKQALYILEHSNLHDFVKKGNPLSATSYENMLKALDYIDEGNEIRMRPINGLPALKVSHSTMAIAMVNADWSTQNMKHSYQHFGTYYNGENAAWGMKDPYKVWYDEEKAYYDKAVANGEFDPNDYESFVKWGKLPSSDPNARRFGKNNEMTVGHYITLVEKAKWPTRGTYKTIEYVTTGYGFSQLPVSEKLGHYRPLVHVQDFASQYIVNGRGDLDTAINQKTPSKLEVFTTDEYRDLLKKWKDGLTTNNFDALEDVQRKLQDATSKLEGAQAKVAPLQQRVDTQKSSVEDAKAKLDALVAKKTADTAALAKAQKSAQAAKQLQDEAKAALAQSNTDLAGASDAVVAAQNQKANAQTSLDATKQKVERAKSVLDQKASDLKALEDAHKALTQKQEELKQAQTLAKNKSKQADEQYDSASASSLAAKNKAAELEAKVAQNEAALQQAQQKLTSAQGVLAAAQASYDAQSASHKLLSQDYAELMDAQNKLDDAKQNQAQAKSVSNGAQEQVDAAEIAKGNAQIAKDNAQARKVLLDGVEFSGHKTAPTSDKELDEKIMTLRESIDKTYGPQSAYHRAEYQLGQAEASYKDALAELIKSKIELDSYTLKVIEGASQKVDSGSAFSFRINRDPEGFKEVLVDGEVVPVDKYSVRLGSTIVTFTKDYSSSLTNGEHTFKALYNNGAFADATFSVVHDNPSATLVSKNAKSTQVAARMGQSAMTPATSDTSFFGSIAAAFAGLAAMGISVLGHKKNN